MSYPNKNPLVSVVLPVYNAERFLAEALDSLLRQTHSNFEIIAINDGSTDGSLTILKRYQQLDERIRVVDQKNHGVVVTANRAIEMANGEYIARMDADDISMPHRLEEEVHILESDPEIVLVCGDFEVIDADGSFRYREFTPTRDADIKRALYLRNPIANGSTMIRKSTLVEVGLFDKVFAEDFHMWMKLSGLGKFAATGSMIYRWRMNPVGLTLSNNDLSIDKGKEYIEERWKSSMPVYVPRAQIFSEANWYFKHLGFYGINYKEAYLTDLSQLAAKLFKHGHKLLALKQLLAIALTGRTGFKIALQRIHVIGRNRFRSKKQSPPFGRAAYDKQNPGHVE